MTANFGGGIVPLIGREFDELLQIIADIRVPVCENDLPPTLQG